MKVKNNLTVGNIKKVMIINLLGKEQIRMQFNA